MKKILLLSAYDAMSHKQWRKGLEKHLESYEWTQISLIPRNFIWRIRNNSLIYAFSKIPEDADFDLIICTSMTDLSALKGMRRDLSGIPVITYFHENQFEYPLSGERQGTAQAAVVNMYTALASDKVLFNSDYNRRTFLKGVKSFLKFVPDADKENITCKLENISSVMHVPLEDDCFQPNKKRDEFTILWNHRWEYDKSPSVFYEALKIFKENITDFRLNVVGQSFEGSPEVFNDIKADFEEHIDNWGFAPSREAYFDTMCSSTVCVSTAVHDFQGLAVQEAAACGCLPVLPSSLAYPEFFDSKYLYTDSSDEHQKALNLAGKLTEIYKKRDTFSAPDISFLKWSKLSEKYESIIKEFI